MESVTIRGLKINIYPILPTSDVAFVGTKESWELLRKYITFEPGQARLEGQAITMPFRCVSRTIEPEVKPCMPLVVRLGNDSTE